MTTRRTPIHRARRPHLTPEMRLKAERLLALTKAHQEAITSGSDDFYDDGRHHELVTRGRSACANGCGGVTTMSNAIAGYDRTITVHVPFRSGSAAGRSSW